MKDREVVLIYINVADVGVEVGINVGVDSRVDVDINVDVVF